MLITRLVHSILIIIKRKKYNFSLLQKVHFYSCHVFYKMILPLDCKKGCWALIIAETVFIINGVFKIKIKIPKNLTTSKFFTKFGIFTIDQSEITNTIIVSPAFERLDKLFLLSLIKKELDHHKKVLFIDVGAHIGTYSIMVGNAFKGEKKLFIYAFEPDSMEFTGKSFSLLKKNIKDNKVKNITVFHVGLGSRDTSTPNKVGVITKRLDSLVKPSTAKQYDTVFIKIDIEGYEKEALEGATEFLKNTKKAVLLIEDYIDKDIIAYLEEKSHFYTKLTPYNAFWIKENF